MKSASLWNWKSRVFPFPSEIIVDGNKNRLIEFKKWDFLWRPSQRFFLHYNGFKCLRSRGGIDLCHVTAINIEINIQATHKSDFLCSSFNGVSFGGGLRDRPRRMRFETSDKGDAEARLKRKKSQNMILKFHAFCPKNRLEYRVTFWLPDSCLSKEQQMAFFRKASQVVGICRATITFKPIKKSKQTKKPIANTRDVKLTFHRRKKTVTTVWIN